MNEDFWIAAIPTFILALPMCLGLLQMMHGGKPWWCYRWKMACEGPFEGGEHQWLSQRDKRLEWTLDAAAATVFGWWRIDVLAWAQDSSSGQGKNVWRVWE
jgi:hypothetical protein